MFKQKRLQNGIRLSTKGNEQDFIRLEVGFYEPLGEEHLSHQVHAEPRILGLNHDNT
jgi:hypothetical protein